ncbi:MAG TPA: ribosome biogenesis GTPase Der [Alphaproteobacteria bacterium]|nr:ribosome biogenesis GTPase Der [Alphaproteobacteria bacterium]
MTDPDSPEGGGSVIRDLAVVAIIGRPNVGKSTLFNRLSGKRLALVDDTPGVTRDRREAEASLAGVPFRIIDTAGLEDVHDASMEARMRAQTQMAIRDADVTLFVIDAREGVSALDTLVAQDLRKQKTPVILVANKAEGKAGIPGIGEAYGLGFGTPIALSAEHGDGLGDLFDALQPYIEGRGPDEDEEEGEGSGRIHVAIVGRPNAGKSTLMNALLGEERVLTAPEAGTTRDAISVDFDHGEHKFRLIDTAGLRRRARVSEKLEQMAVDDTLRAIRLAHVVVLLLDAEAVLDKQDLTIARWVLEEGRALVIAINKWDAVADRKASLQRLSDRLQTSLPQVLGVPTVTISALRGQKLDALLKSVTDIYDVWNRRVSTGQLNRWLEAMKEAHSPPLAKGRTNKLRYMTQVKARPPTFALFVSQPDELPDSYQRYLVNGLREPFGLEGVPIRLLLRGSGGKNPYADDD